MAQVQKLKNQCAGLWGSIQKWNIISIILFSLVYNPLKLRVIFLLAKNNPIGIRFIACYVDLCGFYSKPQMSTSWLSYRKSQWIIKVFMIHPLGIRNVQNVAIHPIMFEIFQYKQKVVDQPSYRQTNFATHIVPKSHPSASGPWDLNSEKIWVVVNKREFFM